MQPKEPALRPKIAIWSSTKEAFSFVWHHKKSLFHLAFAPMVLFFISSVISSFLVAPMSQPPNSSALLGQDVTFLKGIFSVFAGGLYGAAFIMLIIANFRYMILGEHMPGEWVQMAWNWRHWRLIGCCILYGLILMGISLFGGAFVILLLAKYSFPWIGIFSPLKFISFSTVTIGLYLIVSFLFLLYCAVRLKFFLTVVALDGETPLKTSWRMLKGNVGRFLLLIFIYALSICALLMSIMGVVVLLWHLTPFPFLFFSLILPLLQSLYIVIALSLATSFQSVAYKALAGTPPKMHLVALKQPHKKRKKEVILYTTL